MHDAAIIVKPKEMSVYDARTMFGDILVGRGIADWYSADDYRERTIKGDDVSMPLEEFIKDFKDEWLELKGLFVVEYMWPFCIISAEYLEINEVVCPEEFWTYYDYEEERKELLKLEHALYAKHTVKKLEELPNKELYDVILLDYHN